MNDDASKLIEQIYKGLPKELQDILSSEEIAHTLQGITAKYQLHVDQGGNLSDLTTMVLLGLVHPDEFVARIESDVSVPRARAIMLADDINNSIFLPVKKTLMSLHSSDDEGGNIEEETVVPVENPIDLEKHEILHGIENPAPVVQRTTSVPKKLVESMAVNLIENKMSKVIQAPKVETTTVSPATITAPVAEKASTEKKVDPYREAF